MKQTTTKNRKREERFIFFSIKPQEMENGIVIWVFFIEQIKTYSKAESYLNIKKSNRWFFKPNNEIVLQRLPGFTLVFPIVNCVTHLEVVIGRFGSGWARPIMSWTKMGSS